MKATALSAIIHDRKTLLYLLAIGNTTAFAVWQVMLNNFVVEHASFGGEEIGILQSLREVPGFLAFTAILVMLIIRQQSFAILSLLLLGLGTAITAFYPAALWLYFSTVIMSIGFHYLETLHNSLSLQWLSTDETPEVLGKLLSVRAMCNFLVLGSLYIYLLIYNVDYVLVYLIAGGITIAIGMFCWIGIPRFNDPVTQRKQLFLRKNYWLYYALTFLAGARRQIFVVFAGFLLVEKFNFPVENVVLLTLVNSALTFWLAPKIGRLVGMIGERRALTLEYIGLIFVFVSYAFVDNLAVTIALYLLDHLFFAMAIAIKTYFQKIAKPEDIAATSSISFTINHLAAVALPALLGAVWIIDHRAVFLIGAGIALSSLLLSQLIPDSPKFGQETRLGAAANQSSLS
ncbi:MAG TPA: MFS transporter [Gammaproteobacteria bacterium]|nr:MFS transporter [Gammaproteobacteria bacterium]|tara:strand:+ start:184 stop:1389 length:1206 start_codon:yes stop_codon:yes gene_type:complete